MVYHSLYGNPRIVNNEGLRFLNLFKQPVTTEEICKICDEDPEETIREFAEIFFLIEPGYDEKKSCERKKNRNLSKCKSDRQLTGWVLQSVIRVTSDAHTVFTSSQQLTLTMCCQFINERLRNST